MNKNPELTKKELTELCRKQEEYIKELEQKLKTPIDTETLKVAEPSYDELDRERCDLYHQLNALTDENNALRYSLTMMHQKMTAWKNRSDMLQEDYYKENKRAEKLYDELEKKKNNN